METRRLVLAAFFAALPVVLSFFPGSIPVAGAKLLPWQHMTNVLAGVLLGPWYAALAATLAAVLRNAFGVGTVLAFPGGIPGALVVGFAYRAWRKEWVGLLEPIGTGPVGATIGALLIAPAFMGRSMSLVALMSAFLASSVAGAIVGVVVLKALQRLGVTQVVIDGGR
ncbi:MAG: energy coupling factor transporter S component ThiW [Armatimonadetes bacterium]|nr:energy coupling factor transporter S component ThiW [Armatimonadota bacterium]